MNNFTVVKTPIEGLVVVEPKVFTDTRGFFLRATIKRLLRIWSYDGICSG